MILCGDVAREPAVRCDDTIELLGDVFLTVVRCLPSSNPAHLTNVNGTLLFSTNDGAIVRELWKRRGTAATTAQVQDIAAGASDDTAGNKLRAIPIAALNYAPIVTNNHVVEGAGTIQVTFSDDTVITATLLGRDPFADLAVIKVPSPPSGVQPLPLGRSADLRVEPTS